MTPLVGTLPAEHRAEQLERETQRIGRLLFERSAERPPSLLERRWWDERMLNWAMEDPAVKVQLFRFVDVLPMLHSGDDVARHLEEYLGPLGDRLPATIRMALGVSRRLPFTNPAVARAARISAGDMARRFIAGETVQQVLAAAARERRLGRAFTLDILGEAVISEVEAEQFFQSYVELLERVSPVVNSWEGDLRLDADDRGPLPRMNLSIKLSALDSQFDAIDPAGTLARAGGRLRELLRVARRQRAFLNVDMESYDKKDLTLAIFQSVLLEPEFRDVTDVGIVLQCYLRDTDRDLEQLAQWAQARGAPVWVRLVKGAYWDHETIRAKANGWPIPVYQQKWQSDAAYERLTERIFGLREFLRPAFGTHNLRSIAHAIAVAEHLGVPKNGFELQMLYGMADGEKQALVDLGHRLRIYMPYGKLIPGMAYLVRRLLENTANDSFLRAGFMDRVPVNRLLANPLEVGLQRNPSDKPHHTPMAVAHPYPATFANHPPVDFSLAANREAMQTALALVRSELGSEYPLVIDNEPITTQEQIASISPADRNCVVGQVWIGERVHVDLAVAAAKRALEPWSRLPATDRARFLQSAAAAMRERHFELSAWEVYECGKGWREATADVSEAIDFCEYYAREALRLQAPQGADVPGEENRFEYFPRGVAAVIAPWNFPLAILTGMTTAALVTGNTVVMKPSEQSSVMGALLMEVFQEAGLPPGVLNYLPGSGEVVGAALTEHPDVALIAFTGSRAVGLAINQRAAELAKSSHSGPKKVIAELGGKNAIIVDDDADLDEAVAGVLKSAFHYQGQKCSACSRAIVLEGVYDAFLHRLVEATRSLKLGPPDDPSNTIGPVIDDESLARIRNYVQIGKQEGRLALAIDTKVEGVNLAEIGCYVGPHIFADVPPTARIAQEEIFGPVLAVIRARDFDEALRIANGTDYALTGGVFSRSPAHLEQARREFAVGNLYLNRGITGALVGRQPFGGFKFSGIGSKAGGQDYLLQFVLPRTITEHTVRRGFAPEATIEGE